MFRLCCNNGVKSNAVLEQMTEPSLLNYNQYVYD